jgi:hypothetical protein
MVPEHAAPQRDKREFVESFPPLRSIREPNGRILSATALQEILHRDKGSEIDFSCPMYQDLRRNEEFSRVVHKKRHGGWPPILHTCGPENKLRNSFSLYALMRSRHCYIKRMEELVYFFWFDHILPVMQSFSVHQ